MEPPRNVKPSDISDPTAHDLILYGSRGENAEALPLKTLIAGKGNASPIALLVCHGMGQQVRYETISAVAEAIRNEADQQGCVTHPVKVRLCEVNDDFLARAELNWSKDGEEHEIHIYEAYWAPLTEGKVTYWDTVKFLVRAAWNGLWWSKPLMRTSFKRWMFGGAYDMPIGRATWIGLLIALVFVIAQIGAIAYVGLALAQQWKLAFAQPLPQVSGFWHWIAALWQWLLALVPGIDFVRQGHSWFWVALWIGLVAETLFVRYFLIEFAGDVAAYISPYKDSKFDDLRHQIRKIGLNVGKAIYGFGERQATIPDYPHVVVVGHSLGSVVAYDTLNSLIVADQICAAHQQRSVMHRTRALVTFGSPLDKTAFMFRMQANSQQAWTREKLAAAVQPLVVSYSHYRPKWFEWVNIWSPMDIISGSLQYYDRPDVPEDHQQHVHNMRDSGAWVPFYAHVQYWSKKTLRQQLYRLVSEVPKRSDAASAGSQD